MHKWPWAALQEAKERAVDGKSAFVAAYKFAYPFATWGETDSGETVTEFGEEPTDPDCVPCSHGYTCDDNWKPGPV